ncbi:MAG TPA: fibronectin type III domain-containing protein, partial [Stellaceae bacterium]|nr:fibronectin type III domain-containing protein [Stellaceae bacterium]
MTLPNAPQGLAATPSTGSGQATVALSWAANPPSDGVVEYLIFRTPAAYFMPELVAAIAGTACMDSAGELLPNTKWYYFVVAVNAAGTSPAAATAGIAIPLPLPSAPTGLVAAANGNDTVSLSWNANPAGQDVTGYNLYREASGSSSATLRATVSGTSYTDADSALTAGSRWTYYLTAINAAGTSPASAPASVTISLPLPSAPTGLVATANGNDTVSLSWNANPTGQDVTGYDVYREASGSSSATLLATVSGTSYTDADSALTAGSRWTYYLKAINATGTSPASAPASVTIPESAGGTLIATFAVNNYGTVPVANPQISFAQPFAPGDVPSACIIQLRKSDGVTVIPSQQDQESTWLQDGSWKTVAISSVSPDTFAAGETITYQLWS